MRNDVPTIVAAPGCSAVHGRVQWAPVKSLWWSVMALGGVVGLVAYASWSALAVFLLSSAITLCLGHSLGMHRRLIHRSYGCPRWMERLFVYLGTLVGMAGPVGMMRTHDLRDWAQRQPQCHDYFAHRQSFWVDFGWQLHCDLVLSRPPCFELPRAVSEDRVLMAIERRWMLQQLPWAIGLGALGGVGWHNHHHAFPGSAKLGLYSGQADPGWWVLQVLQRLGCVWNLTLPASLPPRAELQALHAHSQAVHRVRSRSTLASSPASMPRPVAIRSTS